MGTIVCDFIVSWIRGSSITKILYPKFSIVGPFPKKREVCSFLVNFLNCNSIRFCLHNIQSVLPYSITSSLIRFRKFFQMHNVDWSTDLPRCRTTIYRIPHSNHHLLYHVTSESPPPPLAHS